MTKRINVRTTDKDNEAIEAIKAHLMTDVDLDAIRYALAFTLKSLVKPPFPPLPDSVRNFSRPYQSPELPVIEPGAPLAVSHDDDRELVVDEYSSSYKPPQPNFNRK